MALLQRDQLLRQRRWGLPFLGLVAATLVVLAVLNRDVVAVVLAIAVAAFALVYVLLPRRAERWAELLARAPDPS